MPAKPLHPNNLLAVVGPTASGKSELAVTLAKKFHGEIISCDSRQIYRGMDIGTGKVSGSWTTSVFRGREKQTYIYKNTPHHLIDFLSPKRHYSVAQFQKQAKKVIREIFIRGNLPILCGGTGHWADAVAYNQSIPEVKPNKKIRAELETKPTDELFTLLTNMDPRRASAVDPHNKRRIIRALEIILLTGKPVPAPAVNASASTPHRTLWLGINLPQEVLYSKIEKRLTQRLRQGMLKEIARLHASGVSWKRLMDFGLEYKFVSLHLQGQLSKNDMITQLSFAIKHYAKRQITWFKRNKNIQWVHSSSEAIALAKNFLKSNN